MKKILAIGASNSTKSINKIFASYIANKMEGVDVTILDWSDVVLPLYSPDLESETGIPDAISFFINLIEEADGIVISLAEHNGLVSAAFKNLCDWTSRVNQKVWQDKPLFLAATSPGGRGGASVLKITKEIIPFAGGNVIEDFSLPLFYDNFKDGKLINEILESELNNKVSNFQKHI